jgi:cobalt-zinc-cadmium efflux system membrane fusion protein
MMVVGGILVALMGFAAWTTWGRGDLEPESSPLPSKMAAAANEVTLSHEILAEAGIETAPVTAQPLKERLQVTGVVEPNEQQIQGVTSLVAGRIEAVPVVRGDRVQAGTVLLTLSSPQIAELQGNLRSAEAKLAEASATLARTKQLVALGVGAGKDLVAAEAEARATEAQAAQLRQSLQALGASATDGPASATVAIRAPMTGSIIERTANPGAWTEAGKPLFTIANLGTVWIIVNVPETRLSLVRVGAPVEIHMGMPSTALLAGRISYVDPQLDRETRTAKVRVEVPNPGERFKIGMFLDVAMEGPVQAGAPQLTVPVDAVQRIGERTIVFVPTADAGRFQIRDVQLGDDFSGVRVVLNGLAAGDRVVVKGGFTLKSQLLKGQFGEDEEIVKKKDGK